MRRASPDRVARPFHPIAPSPRGPRSQRGRADAERAWGLRCAGCGLLTGDCLCAEIPVIAVRTRVVLLVHRAEIRKSTNTGRLVARALEGAEIRVRGDRDAPPRAALPEGRRLLLYPLPGARELTADDGRDDRVVLIVPDGNWPQARHAALRDPDARGAEAVVIPAGAPSRYALRAAPREGALSTMEAVARAMGVLEGGEIERRMMDVFDAFVQRSMRAAGRAG